MLFQIFQYAIPNMLYSNMLFQNKYAIFQYAIPKQRNTKARGAKYIGNAVLLKGITGPEHYWLFAANS